MPPPTIEVLGVYRVTVTNELFQKNFELRWQSDRPDFDESEALEAGKAELESVVLIEVVANNVDGRFDIADFTQIKEGLPQEKWQAPWAEAYMSTDGNSYAGKFRWSAPTDAESIRMAFFMHYWDPSKPLISSHGEILCPAPQPMPERLQCLAPYEILD